MVRYLEIMKILDLKKVKVSKNSGATYSSKGRSAPGYLYIQTEYLINIPTINREFLILVHNWSMQNLDLARNLETASRRILWHDRIRAFAILKFYISYTFEFCPAEIGNHAYHESSVYRSQFRSRIVFCRCK